MNELLKYLKENNYKFCKITKDKNYKYSNNTYYLIVNKDYQIVKMDYNICLM